MLKYQSAPEVQAVLERLVASDATSQGGPPSPAAPEDHADPAHHNGSLLLASASSALVGRQWDVHVGYPVVADCSHPPRAPLSAGSAAGQPQCTMDRWVQAPAPHFYAFFCAAAASFVSASSRKRKVVARHCVSWLAASICTPSTLITRSRCATSSKKRPS